jgi:hypothetical protein
MAASRDPFGAAKMKNRAKLISTLRVSGFADGNVRRGGGQRGRAVARLVTAVLFATQASSFTQVHWAAQDHRQVAQFCVPSESPDAPIVLPGFAKQSRQPFNANVLLTRHPGGAESE